MFEKLEKYVMGPMTKISRINLVRAITAAGQASIPLTIVGSMFLVLNILPLAIPALQGFFEATFFKISDLYMLAFKATIAIISIYFLVAITYEYARIQSEEEGVSDVNPLTAVILSIMALFMAMPQLVADGGVIKLVHNPEANIYNGWELGGDGLARLGATGLFTAIIVSWLVVNIYKTFVKKGWGIKMPEGVPEGVSRSFTALLPAFAIALVMMVIQGVFAALGTDLYRVVAVPFGFVTNLANSWLGILVIYFLISALWIVGIHGATIIGSILSPIRLTNLEQNISQGARNVYAGGVENAFIIPGGSGATLGLVLMMIFLAKSEQLNLLGKVSLPSAIFNINEPIIFGLPIVYNPSFAIPFFLAPMACATTTYFAIKTGLVAPVIAEQPWPTPIGFGAFIASGGDWKAIVLVLINFVLAAAIYYPFLRVYDKKKYEQELAAQED